MAKISKFIELGSWDFIEFVGEKYPVTIEQCRLLIRIKKEDFKIAETEGEDKELVRSKAPENIIK